eukprot:CAMPEP_0113317552 /NCGR_PEP_ID=MMETSP0010_2-20120614/12414_1 /TAXON_ID=216773 ORGANISM="Corethron hystrix, Strain 308" /NCGR_SAMPLE_ID=MMETSP0010_2 /ASSEMBLY_ACC=CAM_ASM_000155 /LENGTH=340 /DNA_ID=CAMNT_0000174555 /DNA_START=183 /DNA_END=1205 /DNA_ORIENTATION=- /assembly_acc=CAM_ASM_000155
MGMTEILKEECEDESDDCDCAFVWDIDATRGHQVATKVFETLAECAKEDTKIWFPSFKNYQGEIDRLTEVLNENSALLGGLQTNCEHWPEVPASVIEVTWPDGQSSVECYEKESESAIEAAIKATENYVEEYICGIGLCPFTKSMKQAAVNLESVGVKEGPVGIRHAGNIPSSKAATPAAVMAAMYWQGVTEIIERPETEVSTFLLVAPSYYDDKFEAFFTACGDLIEKTTILSPGSVGRVWFHPQYKLSEVGESTGGHAPPISEIDDLFDQYLSRNPGIDRPPIEEIEFGHDKTRWTPHATINLLRSSQLKAAKDNQSRAKVFVSNILKILKKVKNKAA